MKNNVLYDGTVYFWGVFQLGLCFLISNALFIVTILMVKLDIVTFPLYFVSIFLTVPAFQALLLTERRVKSLKNGGTLLDLYFRCYKEIFKESCILAGGYVSLLTILVTNLYMYTAIRRTEWLIPLLLLLLILLVIHFLYALLIRVNLIIGMKDTLRLSCYFICKYPVYSIGIIATLFISYWLVTIIPQVSILLLVPILGKGLLKLTGRIFQKILIKAEVQWEKV